MRKFLKTLSISLIAAAAMIILPTAQSSAAVRADLDVHNPNLFGLFCCDFCDSCNDCDSCQE